MNPKRVGILAILVASLMWAIEPVCAKLAYAESDFVQDPALRAAVTTSAVRAFVVCLIALLYALATNGGNLKVARKDVPALTYVAFAGTLFADLLYLVSLTMVPVINAVLIGHMQPIFIVLIGFLVFKEERLSRADYLGIGLVLVAGFLVSTATVENLSRLKLGTLGDLLVLAATVAWATTAIAARKHLIHLNAGVITFYRYSIASLVFIVYLACTSSFALPNRYQLLVGGAVGIGTILYYESIKRIKAALVGALELSTPFFAALLGFVILAEIVTPMQIAGIGLLFAGILTLSRKDA